LQAWALRRQGPDVLPLRLAPRRIYILPTPAGWTFGLLLAVMFIAGLNYGNGLALLFTFWLAGFALVAMVQTQRGLAGAELRTALAEPGFAGGEVTLRLALQARTTLADLALECDGEAIPAATGGARAGEEPLLPRDGELRLAVPVKRRGHWRAPPLRLSSSAPFGLFRTWTWLQLDAATLVYPRPAGTLPVPESPGEDRGATQLTRGLDELSWLRDFREGDSPRGVAWKAYARGAPLLVREYHGAAALRREFDFSTLTGLDTEARLSQLARWVLDAAARGEGWVLRLPDGPPLTGSGAEHREACLARLALFGLRAERR
jgi:uncharacterized protein (DUF58 family)